MRPLHKYALNSSLFPLAFFSSPNSCAAKGISVYSPHTALDAAKGGIQDWLASGLGEGQWQEHPERPRVWELKEGISVEEAVKRIKKHLGMNTDESLG